MQLPDKLGKDLGQSWCTGIVRRISDEENPWIRSGATIACYKAGESVEVNWDAIPDVDMVASMCRYRITQSKKGESEQRRRRGMTKGLG